MKWVKLFSKTTETFEFIHIFLQFLNYPYEKWLYDFNVVSSACYKQNIKKNYNTSALKKFFYRMILC